MPAAGFFDNLGNTIHDVGQAILSMSGPKASNLSDAHYGYDYVVATTQASIDAAMKKFLSKHTEPTTTVCFVADSKGHPQPISFDELKNNAGGVDPFGIPQGADPASDASLQALRRARFMMGFRATLGWPRGLAPDATTIVNLGANTASVEFNMVCADFHVVELNPGTGWDPTPSWLHLTQSPDHPWIFSSKVDMRRVGLDPQMYTKMPNEMQTQINKFITNGAPFSVETLLFDLSNAALQTTPTISGVEAGTDLYRILQTYFIGAYLTQLKLHGEPVLGAQLYAHQPDQATLRMTGYEVEVNPYTDPAVSDVVRQRATTLNYLCTTHATLPPSVQFAWNWVDAADLGDHDGIVAINRNAMRDYLSSHLYGAAKGNCIRPESGSFRNGPGNRYELHLYWDREPTLNTNFPTGSTIFRYEFDSGESYDRSAQDWGDMITQCWYWLQCDIKDETIIITQQLHFYLHLRSAAEKIGGDVVLKTLTDTYSIAIDAHGRLLLSEPATAVNDQSESPRGDWFTEAFSGLDHVAEEFEDFARKFAATNLKDVPISMMQDFVFPGGNTFAFKKVTFSDHQDLVGLIKYVDSNPTALQDVDSHIVLRNQTVNLTQV